MTDSPQSLDRVQLQALVEARTEDTLGHLLSRSGRLLNEEAVAAVRAAGYPEVRDSWVGLLMHLEPEGVRSSVLAERLDITRQAAGQLVSELEKTGYLERVPDPTDGRAKLVRMTERGFGAWLTGLDVLRTIEAELAASVDLTPLLTAASSLLAALESRRSR